ncbi:sensor histidine kinase [Planomonospora sp. ID67723]|uniref:sensor histidine kinase n=1 Tax=Planomonospora sp. ID67723 TaxID=2738134 RepID=UPI0018C358A1|nr:sensor histidine kinase [Planomonospora sp. ID67723]MBG0831063.1 sensor histidine kinase [Planomonospora sp. ID67723]
MLARMTARADQAGVLDPRFVDAVFAVVLTAITLVWAAADHGGSWRRPDAVAVALTCAANLPVAVRRTAPLTVLLGCAAASICHHALGYQPDVNNFSSMFALYSVAVHHPFRIMLAGAAGATAVWWWAAVVAEDGLALLNVTQGLAIVGATCAFGIGRRRLADRNLALAELTERLRREQEDRARRAVTEERVRLAGELHDIVAHHMSVISVQAGLARYVFASDPGTARAALATVADTSHEALEEMRRLLAVLRLNGEDRDDGVYDPTPGLGQLGQLVERVRAAGVPVDVEVTGSARPLNPGVELCAYRVVQEGLTNVIKHALPARAKVRVHYGGEHLRVTVTDDGSSSPEPSSGGGHGLIGMRERVRLYRGTVVAGPLPGGGFQVSATLPLPAVGGEFGERGKK